MVAKVRLEFKLLSAEKILHGHLLKLNLKNAGSNILKNMVVLLHYPSQGLSVDSAKSFVYALMPNAEENVTFRVFVSSLKRVCFSVSGYASGDAYFSMESPVIAVHTRKVAEDNYLLV